MEPLQHRAAVPRHLIFGQTGEGRVCGDLCGFRYRRQLAGQRDPFEGGERAGRTRRAAELAEEHRFTRERRCKRGQERHDLGVEPAAGERAIDAVAVHRREGVRRAQRRHPQPAILREVFAVRPRGHRDRRGFLERGAQTPAPLGRPAFARGFAQVAELVAEVPGQDGRMRVEPFTHRAREEQLGFEQTPRVKVADPVLPFAALGDGAESPRGRRRIERPRRQPVHPAHVAAKKRRHRA